MYIILPVLTTHKTTYVDGAGTISLCTTKKQRNANISTKAANR